MTRTITRHATGDAIFRIVRQRNGSEAVERLVGTTRTGTERWRRVAVLRDSKLYPVSPSTTMRAGVAEVVANREATAREYTQRTARCYVCGRELRDPVRVAAGIGADCESKRRAA